MERKVIIVFLAVFLITGCNEPDDLNNNSTIDEMVNKSELGSLHGKRAYFAHQSVGYNIIEGLNSVILKNSELNFIKIITLEEYKVLRIDESDSSFYFIHSHVGENEHPDLKLNDFESKINSIDEIDVAFLKFCFVDINKFTDVESLYKDYINKITKLGQIHHKTKFVFFTVPLTVRDNIIKRLIKKILNRPDNNINRNKFNKLIRETSNINIFDIAHLESHSENNSEVTNEESLLEEYTFDGGHLNGPGSEKAARELLFYMNNLFQSK